MTSKSEDVRRIVIRAGSVTCWAELNSSPTAQLIWSALPLEFSGNRWGDEIYASIPVRATESAGDIVQEVVQVGDLGYWPPGHAFCIFWGQTPASLGREIRPASPVQVFGHITDDATALTAVWSGTVVRVEKAVEQG